MLLSVITSLMWALVPVKAVGGAQQSSGGALGLYLSSSWSFQDWGKENEGIPQLFLPFAE